jgi:hypothetical protein
VLVALQVAVAVAVKTDVFVALAVAVEVAVAVAEGVSVGLPLHVGATGMMTREPQHPASRTIRTIKAQTLSRNFPQRNIVNLLILAFDI